MAVSKEQEAFITEQRDQFLELSLAKIGISSLSQLDRIVERTPRPLVPVVIEEGATLSEDQASQLEADYNSENGVAYFCLTKPPSVPCDRHWLFEIVDQLSERLRLLYPLRHPMEGHAEATKRFGPSDGTVKIYDLPGRGGEAGYREQAETAELFDMHHDGLGSGGTVETVVLCCDSPPLWGGYTCFQNVCRIALELARDDLAAFGALFALDATVIIRPRGKGAIKVQTPVLFLNDSGEPQSFARVASGEYQVEWRPHSDASKRAQDFVKKYCRPFSPGSTFLNFSARGHGCLIRNRVVAHSRTAFIDACEIRARRCLSRKWYMRSDRDELYKHVPGMFFAPQYARAFPEQCDPKKLIGEWNYDATIDDNMRIR